MLREACEAGSYVLLLLDGTDEEVAALELSVPIHLDPNIKLVGSTLLDRDGKIAWAGGLMEGGNVLEPSIGTDPRGGGYHGQLYCQRLVDVVAGANALITSDMLATALDRLGDGVTADTLMVMLALIAREEGWRVATTPRLEVTLPPAMRSIIPVDRAAQLRDVARSDWAGAVPLES
jgi:hypothetical protein